MCSELNVAINANEELCEDVMYFSYGVVAACGTYWAGWGSSDTLSPEQKGKSGDKVLDKVEESSCNG